MSPGTKSILHSFHPLLQSWFRHKYGNPTDIQELAWKGIIEGKHLLGMAPTGCGKTLAAFFWALNQLITGVWPPGQTRVLYISPLKALNNDVKRNLNDPLEELKEYFKDHGETDFPEISVLTRSGDTPPGERRKMIRNPPEILITTPESLNLIINAKRSRMILTGLVAVIIDEIHAVAGSKRGTHLMTAIERLVLLSGEFQRIGLSATVKPVNPVAEFLGGFIQADKSDSTHYHKRPITVLYSRIMKTYQVEVQSPPKEPDRTKAKTGWQWLAWYCNQRLSKNRSTLIFTNNRRFSEKLTRLINEEAGEILAYTHHGSLSRELRYLVEQKLKSGELKAIVATSSLEMGIDIGALDEILMVGAPTSLTSAIQRIGRGGHSVKAISSGQFLPLFDLDLIRSAVAAKAIIDQEIEPLTIPQCPLDVCAQIILAMTSIDEWDNDELYAFLKTSSPYQHLTRTQYDKVIDMLSGKYADSRIRELHPRISFDKLDNKLAAKSGVRFLLNSSGGTIPDRGYYNLRHFNTKDKIGELDEEFVWERSRGDTFLLGTQSWRIVRIDSQHVEVLPSPKSAAMAPFWRADRYGHGFTMAEKTGLFLKECEEQRNNPDFLNTLISTYFCHSQAAESLLSLLAREREILQCPLPHRYHIVIEHFSDVMNATDAKQVIIHTFWGTAVNGPFTIALAQAWEDKYGYPLQVYHDDSCIILHLPHTMSDEHLISLVSVNNVDRLLRKKLESTGLFGAYFRENAARALLLPKKTFHQRMPLWFNRLRAKKLLAAITSYDDFPILSETWRSCLEDEFDLDALHMVLDEIEDGTITVSDSYTDSPSPFAANLIWRQTNYYVYLDDTPSQSAPSSLREDIIRDLLSSPSLRPQLPQELVNEFVTKLQRTLLDYAPGTPRDMVDWFKERLVIPIAEQSALWSALALDPDSLHTFKEAVNKKITQITIKQSGIQLGIAREHKKRLLPRMKGDEKDFTDNFDEYLALIGEWLRYYGPIDPLFIGTVWGLTEHQVNTIIQELIESQSIIRDTLIEDSDQILICDTQNLEKLLHLRSRRQRIRQQALNQDMLPLFLAVNQGIIAGGKSRDDLQNILDTLWGYPASASLWETEIFPARLQPYYPSWLDTLSNQDQVLWIGCGREKISFCFFDEIELFFNPPQPDDTIRTMFPALQGKYSFADLEKNSQMSSQELGKLLWHYTWKTALSNDQMQTLRLGIVHKYTPAMPTPEVSSKIRSRPSIRFNRWQSTRPQTGNWYYLPYNDEDIDLMQEHENNRRRVYQLLERYGILFKELLIHELPMLRWGMIFRTLRLMELAGEVVTGHFFKGIPGLQVMSLKALRIWQNLASQDTVYWLNACDPISLCGKNIKPLKDQLPERIAANHLVYHDHQLVLISRQKGKTLQCLFPPDSPHIPRYLNGFRTMVSREWQPLKFVRVEMINEQKALKSPYCKPFIEVGFEKTYQGLVLRKSYVPGH